MVKLRFLGSGKCGRFGMEDSHEAFLFVLVRYALFAAHSDLPPMVAKLRPSGNRPLGSNGD